MNQRVLLGGAAAVIALAAGAYLLWGRGGDDPAPSASTPSTDTGVAAPDRDEPTAPVRARVPTRASGGVEVASASDADYVETIDDNGSRRRDHRDGDVEPIIRPVLPHSSKSPVSSKVVDATLKELRPLVVACLADLPDSAFSEGAKVVTRAVVSIDESGKMSVLELGPKTRGIDEVAVEPALQCIRDGAAGLSAQVEHGAVETATVGLTVHPRRRAQ